MSLESYRKKRAFDKTPEPVGGESSGDGLKFVIHEHSARNLHFDLRLEMDGVLKSWAVPKGPSLNPKDKRLAVMTEDHPMEYLNFEGIIPEGNYGAGGVAIWDTGTYELLEPADPENFLKDGKLIFILHGNKLCGEFHMVRTDYAKNSWLLMKKNDDCADPNWQLETLLPPKTHKKHAAKSTSVIGPKGDVQKAVEIEIGRNAQMPSSVSPMLATPAEQPFDDPNWLFETKWDGYRGICFIDGDNIEIVSRGHIDLGEKFPHLLGLRDSVNAKSAIIDGEIVAINSKGLPEFQLLQNASGFRPNSASTERGTILYYVFDLLYCNGKDLTSEPLIARKEALRQILSKQEIIRYNDHILEQGKALFEQAKENGLEGVIAKNVNSKYEQRRSKQWLKIKATKTADVVIGGYTEGRGGRQFFGDLIIGLYRNNKLFFAGHSGGGFTDFDLEKIYNLLQPLRIEKSPFEDNPKTNEKPYWVRPEIVCEVKYSQLTSDGKLRHPVFLGIREDKSPRECIFEAEKNVTSREISPMPIRTKSISADDLFSQPNLKGNVKITLDGAEIALTNLDKIYWPQQGFTKGDMIRYYFEASSIIEHLKDRPLVLKRYPDGALGQFFYQHNIEDPPPYVQSWASSNSKDDFVNYVLCNNLPTLLYLANLGSIELNPWNSVYYRDKVDWILFDLDPGDDAKFEKVCKIAVDLRDVLLEIGLVSFAKTSGSSGMHIYVPVEPLYNDELATNFAQLIASMVKARNPNDATLERLTKKRAPAEVYIDYLQNGQTKTLAAPYSVRAKPGATVSTPLTWDEVEKCPHLSEFDIKTTPIRLREKGDLFAEVLNIKQNLGEALDKIDMRK